MEDGHTYLVAGMTLDVIEGRVQDGDRCARKGCSVDEGSSVVDDILLHDRRRKNHRYSHNEYAESDRSLRKWVRTTAGGPRLAKRVKHRVDPPR